jgi:hypothetical protein
MGSARGSRIDEACPERSRRGAAPKQAFLKTQLSVVGGLLQKFAIASTRSPARETHALPRTARPAPYLLRAFFERGGFATQMGENFAGEMQ